MADGGWRMVGEEKVQHNLCRFLCLYLRVLCFDNMCRCTTSIFQIWSKDKHLFLAKKPKSSNRHQFVSQMSLHLFVYRTVHLRKMRPKQIRYGEDAKPVQLRKRKPNLRTTWNNY